MEAAWLTDFVVGRMALLSGGAGAGCAVAGGNPSRGACTIYCMVSLRSVCGHQLVGELPALQDREGATR
jgi:hypothetical protein